MRLRWAILMLMVGIVAVAPAQTPDPFMLRISGPATVAVGQPVLVRVLLQNTSNHPIAVDPLNPDGSPLSRDGSLLSIKGPTGQELSRKQGSWGGSAGINQIAAYGVIEDDILRVDSIYDLTQPGKYTLQLKRPIAEHGSDEKGFVSSNTITVIVSSDPVKPSAPMELVLSGPETFVSGNDVSLKVSVKNISDQDIFLVTDPDGSVDDRYYHLETIVGPNNAVLSRFLAHSGQKMIQAVSHGATLEATLDKSALGFNAEWIAPRTYRFQLFYSATADWGNNLAESNVLTLKVTPPPAGGPTPLRLRLRGAETVAAGDPVRVDLAETNTSNFETICAEGQLNPLERYFSTFGYSFSVRDPSGDELQLNTQVNVVTKAPALGSHEPGSTSNSYAILSDFYDMSRPGAYRVQMSHHASGYPEAGPVFSNVITINVTPSTQR